MTPVTSNLSISNPREFLPSAKYKYTPSNSKKLESFKTKKDQIICKIFKKNKAPLYPCYIDKSSTKCLKVNCKIAEAKLGNIKSVREKWFSCLSPKVDNSPLALTELNALKTAYQKGLTSWTKLSRHLFKTLKNPNDTYRSAGFLKNNRNKFNGTSISKQKKTTSPTIKIPRPHKKQRAESLSDTHSCTIESSPLPTPIPYMIKQKRALFDHKIVTPFDTLDLCEESFFSEDDEHFVRSPCNTPEVAALLSMSAIVSPTPFFSESFLSD